MPLGHLSLNLSQDLQQLKPSLRLWSAGVERGASDDVAAEMLDYHAHVLANVMACARTWSLMMMMMVTLRSFIDYSATHLLANMSSF